jgi:hypothetical protein
MRRVMLGRKCNIPIKVSDAEIHEHARITVGFTKFSSLHPQNFIMADVSVHRERERVCVCVCVRARACVCVYNKDTRLAAASNEVYWKHIWITTEKNVHFSDMSAETESVY